MPKNNRESLIYTLMMCFVMVLWMSIYNVSLHNGEVSWTAVKVSWLGMPLAYCCALVLDWFVVSSPAKKIAFHLLPTSASPLKTVVTVSTCMVLPMVFFMSLYGTVETLSHTQEWNQLLLLWGKNSLKNVLMALPFQLLIAGPLVRKIFRRFFPEGTVLA